MMSKPMTENCYSASHRTAKVRRAANVWRAAKALCVAAVVVSAIACTPTVKVATDEPITINLNVNIKHEILVKVDKELDDVFSEDSDLF